MADQDIREGEPEPAKQPVDAQGRPRDKRSYDDDEADFERKSRDIAKGDDGSNTPLSAVVPVGVSLWALASLYLSLLGCVIPGLGLVGILCGIMAFVTHKHQASYGSITGNIRAILGIGIGLVVSAIWLFVLFGFLTRL